MKAFWVNYCGKKHGKWDDAIECKRLGRNALHAGQRKRQRVEHVGQEHIHHMLLRNCSNCQRTELHL